MLSRIDLPAGKARIVALIAAGLLAAALGAGGYLIGDTGSDSLAKAREAGAAAGREDGAARGAKFGYAEGFAATRGRNFDRAYEKAYQRGYAKAFRDAGYAPPANVGEFEPVD